MGIHEYLRNGGKLEVAKQISTHKVPASIGSTASRKDQVSLVE